MTESDAYNFALAYCDYFNLFGSYPVGSNSEIYRALSGRNSQNTAIIENFPRLNDREEMLDPWASPYDLSFVGDKKLRVLSAGPNRKFGDSDDKIKIIDLAK